MGTTGLEPTRAIDSNDKELEFLGADGRHEIGHRGQGNDPEGEALHALAEAWPGLSPAARAKVVAALRVVLAEVVPEVAAGEAIQ